jgi:site-specific DNA-methyltransferase (adenine-specific)
MTVKADQSGESARKAEIVWMSPRDLIPYGNNPRKNDKAVDAVAASIREFGFNVPITCDEKRVVATGHTRLKAALRLGLDKVPVIVLKNLTEDQIKVRMGR